MAATVNGSSDASAQPLWRRQFADFRSAEAFPVYADLPNEHEFHPDYYVQTGPSMARHRKHWALLSEIESVEMFTRVVLNVKDRIGQTARVAFYTDRRGEELNTSLLKPGNAVINLYGLQHQFFDGSFGIREEDVSSVKVLPMSLENVLRLSDRVHTYCSDHGGGVRMCHGCDKESRELQKCAHCLMFWYCSKDCQENGWRNKGHKTDCRVIGDADMKTLFQKDWSRFDDFIHLDKPHILPR